MADLEKDVWGYTDAEDVVPPPVLIVSVKRGGILLGAFDDRGAMKGFVYSIPAIKDGRLTQWSHMLGVTRDARDAGLGLRLKLAQRERALQMGIDLDRVDLRSAAGAQRAPQLRQARRRRRGVRGEHLRRVEQPAAPRSPTDRFVAEWRLTAPHVERRIAARRRSASCATRRWRPRRWSTRRSRPAHWLAPGAADCRCDAPRLLVEIPVGYAEMQVAESGARARVADGHARDLPALPARGYRVVDFFLSREAGRGHYLLALRTAT